MLTIAMLQLRTSKAPKTLKGTISFQSPQPGNISPKIDSSTTVQLSSIGKAGPFTLYSIVHKQTLTSLQFFSSSIDIENEDGEEKAMFYKLFSILQFF